MQLEQPVISPFSPLRQDKVKETLKTGVWQDEEALALVVQDAERAESFEITKQWVMQWPTATTLYQSPVTPRYWPNTQIEAASIPFFTVATVVNSMVPQIVNGLFYESPPFVIQQRPGTSFDTTRAIKDILAYQLEDINFREEIRLGVLNCLLYGTAIWKWGWETFTRERKIYKQARPIKELISSLPDGKPITFNEGEDIIEEEVIEEYVDRPTFEHIVNLRHILVDPGLNVPDIRKAKYVIHRMYLTWRDLEKLRDRPGFNIPSREELLDLFFPPKEPVAGDVSEDMIKNPLWDARADSRWNEQTADPFSQPLEVLERWDNDKYICVLQKKLVLANDANPYGKIPYLSVGWWDIPEAFWSMGLAKTVGAEQRLQQGITNTWLDNAALNLNGVYVRVRGKSVPTQSIRIAPGRIVEVDSKDDFQVLERLPAVPEAGQHLALSQQRAESVSGATETSTQGIAGATGHSNVARTAAGVNMLGAGTGSRVSDFVEKLTTNVFLPYLYESHQMNCSLLPVATIQYILNEELQHDYLQEGGTEINILNAKVRFSILAAAKMRARQNMAQALPILIQFLTSPQTTQQLVIEAKKVKTSVVLRMMFEVSDWKNMDDVVVDMTPQDQQRSMMQGQMGPIAAKAQIQSQLQNQKFGQQQQLVDQENISRAGRELLRQAMMEAAKPEETTGEPGGVGFGSNA